MLHSPKICLNNKYTSIHAIQKYGPVAQPGRVPDFYHFGRDPAVSGSNPDGPEILFDYVGLENLSYSFLHI